MQICSRLSIENRSRRKGGKKEERRWPLSFSFLRLSREPCCARTTSSGNVYLPRALNERSSNVSVLHFLSLNLWKKRHRLFILGQRNELDRNREEERKGGRFSPRFEKIYISFRRNRTAREIVQSVETIRNNGRVTELKLLSYLRD